MGQYYKPVIVNDNMDIISWICSHDYDNGLKLMEHSYVGNNFVSVMEKQLYLSAKRICWCGDYAEHNYYELAEDDTKLIDHNMVDRSKFKFIINHETKEFCKIPEETNALTIHPLPLLTALGNGEGGGDYEGPNMDLIGIWAVHLLEIVEKVPYGFEEILADFY